MRKTRLFIEQKSSIVYFPLYKHVIDPLFEEQETWFWYDNVFLTLWSICSCSKDYILNVLCLIQIHSMVLSLIDHASLTNLC